MTVIQLLKPLLLVSASTTVAPPLPYLDSSSSRAVGTFGHLEQLELTLYLNGPRARMCWSRASLPREFQEDDPDNGLLKGKVQFPYESPERPHPPTAQKEAGWWGCRRITYFVVKRRGTTYLLYGRERTVVPVLVKCFSIMGSALRSPTTEVSGAKCKGQVD